MVRSCMELPGQKYADRHFGFLHFCGLGRRGGEVLAVSAGKKKKQTRNQNPTNKTFSFGFSLGSSKVCYLLFWFENLCQEVLWLAYEHMVGVSTLQWDGNSLFPCHTLPNWAWTVGRKHVSVHLVRITCLFPTSASARQMRKGEKWRSQEDLGWIDMEPFGMLSLPASKLCDFSS